MDQAPLSFTITPDATNPASFIISSQTGALRQRLAAAIDAEAAAKQARQEIDAEESRLNATIKPAWLMGRWVKETEGSDACGTGPYLEFAKGNVLHGPSSSGSWRLRGRNLQIIMPSQSMTLPITSADEMSLGFGGSDDGDQQYRRCSADETVPNLQDATDIVHRNPDVPAPGGDQGERP